MPDTNEKQSYVELREEKLKALLLSSFEYYKNGDILAAMRALEQCSFREEFFKDSLIDERRTQPIIYIIKKFITHLNDDKASEAFLKSAIDHAPTDSQYSPYIPILAELYLSQGHYQKALRLAEKSLAYYYNELFTQNILIEAKKALGYMPADYGDTQGKICLKPFQHFEISPGNKTWACCPGYLPYSIGNCHDSSINDTWNSDAAQKIRESMLEGSFKYCSKLSCPIISSNKLEDLSNVENGTRKVSPVLRDAVINKKQILDYTPLFVNLSHDVSCNLSCPSCRKNLILAKSAERKELDKLKTKFILPLLKKARSVHITGSGDPFGSKHFRSVLSDLNDKDYPKLRITLQTNGVLFTKEEWVKLAPIHSLIHNVYVSIDATTPHTYSKVRRGGDFEKLLKNMEMLSRLRKNAKLEKLTIAFVVQNDNFMEMEQFVQMGINWGVDNIVFSRIRQWGTFTEEEFKIHNIFSHNHPNHEQFQNILSAEIFNDPCVYLGNL